MNDKRYAINEIFYSLQGEGVRQGTANVFIRFTGCNLRCEKGVVSDKSPGNFSCDTEFMSGRLLSLSEIHQWVIKMDQFNNCKNIIMTGGEPALQVDKEFCDYFHRFGYYLAIETNGSIELPYEIKDTGVTKEKRYLLDWICVSPKVAEHCIKQLDADEVRYVRGWGQAIPKTVITNCTNFSISPAFEGNELDKETLQWCIDLVKQNPQWRLSVQQHKSLMVR